MPQAPRTKDNATQKAQDKESKRARGALSCAECRRLKLKCDKTVPCSSCKRRGCSAICPNGSLITGQGTRFVLADTEKLHQKIATMSDRIRQLEDALAILQSAVAGPGETHPLLTRDLLKIKSSIELHSASTTGNGPEELGELIEEGEENEEQYIDAFGTLAIRDDGAATFYGRSAGSESLLIGEVSEPTAPSAAPLVPAYGEQVHGHATGYPTHPAIQNSFHDGTTLPTSITHLAASFPLAPSLSSTSSGSGSLIPSSPSSAFDPASSPVTLQHLIDFYLPSYSEALRLVQLYLEQAPWFFGAVTRRQIDEELLPLWYREAAECASSASTPPPGGLVVSRASPSSSSGTIDRQRTGTSHDLALLFIIFCFGNLTDINLPSPPDNRPAEKYYQLTKASLTLDSNPNPVSDPKVSRNGILERPPSVATVQTLSLMAIYEGICSGENSIESTWALMGLASKLAQSIGLHRDCARWKLTPAEVQKRRALFWELFITDCWQSLATGRLATFSLPFVDCELPQDTQQTIANDGSIQPSFSFWKARFGAECVSAVVQGTLTSRAPKYSIILDLDRKVRDMELPAYAQGPIPQGLGLAETMSHFMPVNYRELTLLYIHRCFFAHAIASNPQDPIKSTYAPSFLAGYRSACTIIASVKQQFTLFPAQIARFWVLWTHTFSASVMLASVATHSSRSKIAPAALLELKTACDLFEMAAGYGGRAVKFLPILRRLQGKAQQAFRDANRGIVNVQNDIFRPSNPDETKDEFSIFSGKTHTVSTKSNLASSSASSSNIHGSARSGTRALSDSPPQSFMKNPSFANAHPSLVSELNDFHGHIKVQIQNAYRAGSDIFGAGPMVVDAPLTAPQQHATLRHEQLRQQQLMYQQQQEIQRLEQEREEAERQEAEQRQAEFERQQQVERQRQQEYQRQQEILRQQQKAQQEEAQRQQQHAEELRRQEQLQEQSRQAEYRRQMEGRQQPAEQNFQGQASYGNIPTQQPMYTTPPHHSAPSISPQHSQHSQHAQYSSHSMGQSQHGQPEANVHPVQSSSVQQHHVHHQTQPPSHVQQPVHHQAHQPSSYQYQQPINEQHHHHVPATAPQTHAQNVYQHSAPPQVVQQPLYNAPPQVATHATAQQPAHYQPQQAHVPPQQLAVYSHQGHQEYHQGANNNGHAYPATTSTAEQPQAAAYNPPPQHQRHQAVHYNNQYVSETYNYWPAATSSFAMPRQEANGVAHAHHQHYTPEGALRGIAADDRSLQETWQSYMNKVGSPRQFMED